MSYCHDCWGTGIMLYQTGMEPCACLNGLLFDMVEAFCGAVVFGESELPDDAEFSQEAMGEIIHDCARFLSGWTDVARKDVTRFGADFYFTAAGHGCGFWDGDWPENGQALTKACEPYGWDFYVGDDGLVYIM